MHRMGIKERPERFSKKKKKKKVKVRFFFHIYFFPVEKCSTYYIYIKQSNFTYKKKKKKVVQFQLLSMELYMPTQYQILTSSVPVGIQTSHDKVYIRAIYRRATNKKIFTTYNTSRTIYMVPWWCVVYTSKFGGLHAK